MKTLILIVLAGFIATAAARDWRDLDGLRANHDGANCFNAVLVGAGFLDKIGHSDGSELDYYLKNYCSRVTTPQPGDLLVIKSKGSFNRPNQFTPEHAAIWVGDSIIFDKDSIAGFYGRFTPWGVQDHSYGIRRLNDSSYVTSCTKPYCVKQTWRCADPVTVRRAEKLCDEMLAQSPIGRLRARFESITFDPSPTYEMTTSDLTLMRNAVAEIEAIHPAEACARRRWAAASSIVFQTFAMNEERELPLGWHQLIDRLKKLDQVWPYRQ